MTLMNIAGKNVKLAVKKLQVEKTHIIILHDCLETKFGVAKLILPEEKKSFKGHNGLKSVSQELGGFTNFSRIAIGIGRPEARDQITVADYVLSGFNKV